MTCPPPLLDNYQGEESEIVITTLTRSNRNHDIGFMFSPERLNVLLSRARVGMIMIGNADTFTKSRKGGELWTRLINMLRTNGHIYEGLPIRCDRHPDRTAMVKDPKQFEVDCPDGGCQEPWSVFLHALHSNSTSDPDQFPPSEAKLSCGRHTCQSKCHQIRDHSKMPCKEIMTSNCPNNHAQTWKCHQQQPVACRVCDREAKRAAEKLRKDFELQKKRDAEQQEHEEKMAKLKEKMDAQIQAQKDLQLAKDREAALKQQEQDIKDAEERLRQRVVADKKRREEEVKRQQEDMRIQQEDAWRQQEDARRRQEEARRATAYTSTPSNSISATLFETVRSAVSTLTGTTPGTPSKQPSPEDTSKKEKKKRKESEAGADWQRRKYIDGVSNPHIDAIMEMIGLEEVKKQVLRIMDKVDVNIRQGTSLSKERFNAVLLGNPGTGIVFFFARCGIFTDNIVQGRLLWRGTTPNSWLLSISFPVTNSRRLPEPSSETMESLAPKRSSRTP